MRDERQKIVDEVDSMIARQKETDEKIAALVSYLTSDKFRTDPTVQVVDVLTRLGAR